MMFDTEPARRHSLVHTVAAGVRRSLVYACSWRLSASGISNLFHVTFSEPFSIVRSLHLFLPLFYPAQSIISEPSCVDSSEPKIYVSMRMPSP